MSFSDIRLGVCDQVNFHFQSMNEIQVFAHNKRMQSDKLLRFASQFAADARRYLVVQI